MADKKFTKNNIIEKMQKFYPEKNLKEDLIEVSQAIEVYEIPKISITKNKENAKPRKIGQKWAIYDNNQMIGYIQCNTSKNDTMYHFKKDISENLDSARKNKNALIHINNKEYIYEKNEKIIINNGTPYRLTNFLAEQQ